MFAVTSPWDVTPPLGSGVQVQNAMRADTRERDWQNGPAVGTDSVPCFHSVECDRAHQLGKALLTQRGFYRTVSIRGSSPPQPCSSTKKSAGTRKVPKAAAPALWNRDQRSLIPPGRNTQVPHMFVCYDLGVSKIQVTHNSWCSWVWPLFLHVL